MKFQREHGRHFKFRGVDGTAYMKTPAVASGDVAVIDLSGRHGQTKTTTSDRIYYIISGEGTFIIGTEVFVVEAEDVILVKKDMSYDFEGEMKLVVFSAPAFDPAGEVDLETEQSYRSKS